NFLRRRVARNNFAQRSSSFQHRLGHSVSRRTGQFSSGRWNALDRGGGKLNFFAAPNLASLIFLVGSLLFVWRRFPSLYSPSAGALCFGSRQRAALSCRYHWDRRAALVGELHSFADQGRAAGLEPTIDGLVFNGRCF